MASLQASSGQGALFELVARGMKDKYFVKDAVGSVFPYDASYLSSCPHLAERKTAVPVNGTPFGGTFEVEIDAFGDVMTECALEIDLPSWFPPLPVEADGPTMDPALVNGLYPITSTAGESYGYVDGVGYFLFERIQFYQDQILIQEWSGDGLWAKQRTEGSNAQRYLREIRAGSSVGDASGATGIRSLQWRATPGRVRVVLPLPGMQCPEDGGLPLLAMTWQTLRLRITLRRLEDLIVSTDTLSVKPAPWNVPSFHYTLADGMTVYSFAPLKREAIGAPHILLSTIQHYVSPEIQQELRNQVIHIPFRRQFENRFTFGELDYISLDKGGVAAVTRRVDGRHPTERIFWFFRTSQAEDHNRLDDVRNDYFENHLPTETQPYTEPSGGFYYRLKFVIAGRDREALSSGLVWNGMVPWTKDENGGGAATGIGEMRWSLGERFGVLYPAGRQPEGTLNLTTADRPTLYIELANVATNPLLAQRKTEMRVFTEGWNVYEIREGRGRMMFAS